MSSSYVTVLYVSCRMDRIKRNIPKNSKKIRIDNILFLMNLFYLFFIQTILILFVVSIPRAF